MSDVLHDRVTSLVETDNNNNNNSDYWESTIWEAKLLRPLRTQVHFNKLKCVCICVCVCGCLCIFCFGVCKLGWSWNNVGLCVSAGEERPGARVALVAQPGPLSWGITADCWLPFAGGPSLVPPPRWHGTAQSCPHLCQEVPGAGRRGRGREVEHRFYRHNTLSCMMSSLHCVCGKNTADSLALTSEMLLELGTCFWIICCTIYVHFLCMLYIVLCR